MNPWPRQLIVRSVVFLAVVGAALVLRAPRVSPPPADIGDLRDLPHLARDEGRAPAVADGGGRRRRAVREGFGGGGRGQDQPVHVLP